MKLVWRMKARIFACCAVLISLAGCTGLPTAGPTASQVMDQAAREPRRFDMIEVNGRVISALRSQPGANLLGRFEQDGKPPAPTIRVGDTLSVAIWQSTDQQMLVPRQAAPGGGEQGGGNTTIPDQIVGADGAITVPFAGRVPVAGRTPAQVQAIIEQRLAEQVVQPQVLVTVTRTTSNSATIFGEDIAGARIPLSPGGDRLLDVIATAGGSKSPFYATSIRLSRHGQTAIVPMTSVVSNPQENIYVWPGDIISVVERPQTFSVFGATSTNAQVLFGADQLDLAQAIAKAGGLLDTRADPDGVFLFRFEPPAVIHALGAPNLATQPDGYSPVVYHLNLRQIDGYFLADRFPMENKDLIYVANARMTELQKFFTLIGSITGPVISGVVVTQGVK